MEQIKALDNKAIEIINDRLAITDLLYRYCRAVDRIDPGLGYTIWHEDGQADYGEAIYRGSGVGFIDWVCESHRGLVAHSHQLSNILIRLDGHTAGSEAYVTATLRFRQDDRLMANTVCGRYIDRWSKRDGRWGIDRRQYIHDFDELREVKGEMFSGWGRRDETDQSYTALPARR